MYINKTCLDYDECKEKICAHGAFCSNNIGGFSCICRLGYKEVTEVVGESRSNRTTQSLVKKAIRCVDIDECYTKSVCPKNAECQNTEGGYICKCLDGFEGDYCADIDECNNTARCDVNAECLNAGGGYKCTCKQGATQATKQRKIWLM